MKRNSIRKPECREGTDGASPYEGGGEGISELRSGSALPEASVMGKECGLRPEFRWNHGHVLFALSQLAWGVFLPLPPTIF